ncbi:unnamed protein product [Toxocara canis]|uniref:C6 domain-containing protein n=1 Tax=Toxocara canis TaxID=6265 RepID=A0A183V9B3_TOXCA|nr:unnamed protein product [Toxocara canis]
MTGTATVTAVTEHTNSCGNTCSNLHISNVTFFNTTLGTITTNYYIASDGCRYLEMTCSAMDGQDVLLGANGNLSSIVTTGVPSATLNMTCGVDSMWFLSNSSNEVIHSLSCLSVPRLNQTNGNATTNSTSSPTATPAPPCLSCPRLKPSDSPKNVFITLDHGIKNNCSTVSVSCSSSQPGGTVVLVVNGISSNHSTIANLSCTCSPQNIWLDNATGQQVKTVICLRYFPETTVPTTPIPTTTAAPGSPCTNCSNLKSVYTANMSAGAIEGRLVLDHYISRTGCRSVDIQCSSETGGQRAAIIFNGNVSNPYAVATTSVVTTLYCNSKSQWTNRNGTFIANNVTCILLPATNTTTNVTTTPTPILSTTATTRALNSEVDLMQTGFSKEG